MGTTIAELESKRAREIADEWRSRGYEVTIHPKRDQLPSFMKGFSPDLLMRKGDESVVVEIKSRPTMEREGRPSGLAGVVRDRPGWNYWLVPVNVGEQLRVPKGVRSFTREDVLNCAAESERLLDAGFADAAFIQACAAADGAVRILLDEEGELLGRPPSEHAITLAAQEGVISMECYFFLRDALRKRNALVHGFALPDTDAEAVRGVMGVAKRLLDGE